MRKLLSFCILVLGLSAILPFLSSEAHAQGIRMGFIQDERIKEEYKAWQKAQEDWEIEARTWEEEAVTKQDELKELEEEYERQKLILSEEKKRQKEDSVMAKAAELDAFTRQIYGPGGEAERRQAELIQPLLEQISQAIEAVAIAEDYDVVFTLQSGLGYIKESYDMTDKVLEYLAEEEG